MPEQHSHCSYCGSAFSDDASWPRTCGSCGETTYLNPTPVSVVIQPIDGGVLTIRRDFGAESGRLALPGGFIDRGESWREAGARELDEETGLEVEASAIDLFDVMSAPDGTLLVFGEAPEQPSDALPPFEATREVSERVVVDEARELAFPLHTDALAAWYGTQASD